MSDLPIAPLSPDEVEALEHLRRKSEALLRERKKHFGVPDIEFEPAAGDVILYRLPAPELKTEGGLFLPGAEMNNHAKFDEQAQARGEDRYVHEDAVVNNGMLLAAGLDALDWLLAHGIFVGDFVSFGRFAGHEQSLKSFATFSKSIKPEDLVDILQTHARDIRGSFDLHARLHTEPVLERRLVVDSKGLWMHALKPIVRSKRK